MSPEHQEQQQEQKNRRHLSRWLTEEEFRDGRVSHKRFMALANRRDVNVHAIDISSNSFGEYLFVTLSRSQHSESPLLTFFGLGYHEYRERWITNLWCMYQSCQKELRQIHIPKNDALQQIEERLTETLAMTKPAQQSPRAKVYELFAEFTDEDAAIGELEDLGWPHLGFADE